MRCPNCDQSLRPCQYESATIHTCDGCHGEFIGAGELREIVNTREKSFSLEVLAAIENRAPSFGVPDGAKDRSLACPACDMAMDVLNYAADTAVIVDRCPSCGGVWLDDDELEHIQGILEQREDRAPDAIRSIQGRLDQERQRAREASSSQAPISRFDFVSAMINRLLDRAA